jgi:RNA polymerase sigma-70 factor (family 1)
MRLIEKFNNTVQEHPEQIRVDDPAVFNQLYTDYWQKLYVYAFKVLQDQRICEDIVQEIFLALWKNRQHVVIDNASAYFYQAVRFQLYKNFRDKKLKPLDIDKFNDYHAANDLCQSLNREDLEREVVSKIKTLPVKCKEIFYLSRFEELTHDEIAQKLNISTRTVKNQVSRALSYLRLNFRDAFFLLTYLLWRQL